MSTRVIFISFLTCFFSRYSAVTHIGKYYRTTIPGEVKKILELKENDEIEWVLESDKIIVRKKGKSHG